MTAPFWFHDMSATAKADLHPDPEQGGLRMGAPLACQIGILTFWWSCQLAVQSRFGSHWHTGSGYCLPAAVNCDISLHRLGTDKVSDGGRLEIRSSRPLSC